MAETSSKEPTRKRMRTEEGPSDTGEPKSQDVTAVVIYDGKDKDTEMKEPEKARDYVERNYHQVVVDVNPSYISSLKSSKELGYGRPAGKRSLKVIFIELKLAELRKAIEEVVSQSLVRFFFREGRLRTKSIVAEAKDMVPLIRDATMNAIYSKLRFIHKLHGEHAKRYSQAASYSKDVELPLPLSIAVQDLGTFEVRDMKEKFIIIPDYPEDFDNEGRGQQKWSSLNYEAYVPVLKELGIPMRSVNTNIKNGSAWWTYKVEANNSKLDLICTLPPLHYSNHSAVVRSLFLTTGSKVEESQIIELSNLNQDYGTMFRECAIGHSTRAFHALCHTREEDWNLNMG